MGRPNGDRLPRILRLLLVGLVAAGAGMVACPAAAAEPCLECHGLPGLRTPEKSLWVHPEAFADGVHGRLACSDCHKGASSFPHSPEAAVRCDLRCHVPGASHEELSKAVEAGVHAGVRSPACLTCHPSSGVVDAGETEALCRSCHRVTDRARSVYPDGPGALGALAHGRLDPRRRPSCDACHGVHTAERGEGGRAGCSAEGCHPGAAEGFASLFDHGGAPERRPWGGTARGVAGAGAALALVLFLHLTRVPE